MRPKEEEAEVVEEEEVEARKGVPDGVGDIRHRSKDYSGVTDGPRS
jgi:hypothetical protein